MLGGWCLDPILQQCIVIPSTLRQIKMHYTCSSIGCWICAKKIKIKPLKRQNSSEHLNPQNYRQRVNKVSNKIVINLISWIFHLFLFY